MTTLPSTCRLDKRLIFDLTIMQPLVMWMSVETVFWVAGDRAIVDQTDVKVEPQRPGPSREL